MAVTVCWSAKAGAGTTVVAAALALTNHADTLLVDLAGDLPAALGLDEPAGQGLAEWFRSCAPAESIADLAVDVTARTRLVPFGGGAVSTTDERWERLAAWLANEPAEVVVDGGSGPPPAGLMAVGARSLLVTRSCYLALRRATRCDHRPAGVVLVAEPGRGLRAVDVARAVGAPIVATVSVDPAVARAVDAGLLRARLPRPLAREIRGALPSDVLRVVGA